ncbi:hypothetical protein KP509_35G017600 [Ceratopteris richardii]|uniref:Uncharacterized protein n=1 Tax=Ceratopteris richardii TaxID=49495 RepID=A0A8T2QEQ9_CERRI|nr:hypothetical protein KP509_35G017600 [Ceratopteris richardii]
MDRKKGTVSPFATAKPASLLYPRVARTSARFPSSFKRSFHTDSEVKFEFRLFGWK